VPVPGPSGPGGPAGKGAPAPQAAAQAGPGDGEQPDILGADDPLARQAFAEQ
jgi:hypothetical protein